jgi:hypothetical protein
MEFLVFGRNIDAFWNDDHNVLWNRLISYRNDCGFGGLEDAYLPLVPKFAASNPAEAAGFFRAKKSPARLPSEGK